MNDLAPSDLLWGAAALIALLFAAVFLGGCTPASDLFVSCVPDAHAPTKPTAQPSPDMFGPDAPESDASTETPPPDTLAFDSTPADVFPLDSLPPDSPDTSTPTDTSPSGCLARPCAFDPLSPFSCNLDTHECVPSLRLFDLCDPTNPMCAPGSNCNQDPHSPNWRCLIPCGDIFDCPRATPDLHCVQNTCAPLNPTEDLSVGYYTQPMWDGCGGSLQIAGGVGCACESDWECALYGVAHLCTDSGMCR